jgi:hypothetical protein
MPIIASLHYNPSIAYFAGLLNQEELVLEACENYQKQSYRNRCHILTAQGIKSLIVPVLHTNPKILITDVKIDYSQRWTDVHWRTIKSAYGSAPYFIYYADVIQEVYASRPALLFDLNTNLLRTWLKLLDIDIAISFTTEFRTNYPTSSVDSRNLFHPKSQTDNLPAKPYVQVFGRGFVNDLSILDLLFNLGPEANAYLRRIASPG